MAVVAAASSIVTAFAPSFGGAVSGETWPPRVLLGKNELREQTSVSQAALKILQAHREVVAFYYWPPCGISKSGRGEIDLLEDEEAVRFKHSAHHRGAHKETRRL